MMQFINRLGQRADLVNRMAGALGIDIGNAMLHGDLGGTDLRRMVYQCAGCGQTDACKHFLAETAEIGANHAPGYCRNRDVLERLAGE